MTEAWTSSEDRAFFFQAEDGIRDLTVTGVQTCALPISGGAVQHATPHLEAPVFHGTAPGRGVHGAADEPAGRVHRPPPRRRGPRREPRQRKRARGGTRFPAGGAPGPGEGGRPTLPDPHAQPIATPPSRL